MERLDNLFLECFFYPGGRVLLWATRTDRRTSLSLFVRGMGILFACAMSIAQGVALGQSPNTPAQHATENAALEYPDVAQLTSYAFATSSSSTMVDPAAVTIERSTSLASSAKGLGPRIAWVNRHSLDLGLGASLTYDMYWTYQNMTHPLGLSYDTCNAPWGWELTMAQCLVDPFHTVGTVEFQVNPNFFSEGGWTKIFGRRNVGMTIAGQTAQDALLAYLNLRLSKKGRVDRMIGRGLMTGKIVGHILGGRSNIIGIAQSERLIVPAGVWNVRWH